jgi:hypothetical protein
MRGIAISKGLDYIFQKKPLNYFLFSPNFFFLKKKKKDKKRRREGNLCDIWLADHPQMKLGVVAPPSVHLRVARPPTKEPGVVGHPPVHVFFSFFFFFFFFFKK